MSTDFQKDLYKKSGSLLTPWDICIGLGLITLGSGVYMHFKESKKTKSIERKSESLGMGSLNKHKSNRESPKLEKVMEVSKNKSKKEPTKSSPEQSEETLSKLGL